MPQRRSPPLGAGQALSLGFVHRAIVSRDELPFYFPGHVEDVVVDSSTRGTGLGKLMVNRLTDMAIASGCYKIILNCAAACKAAPQAPCQLRRLGLRCTSSVVGLPMANGASHAPSTDCVLVTGAQKNIGFYEKCGYVVKEVSMAKYLDH